MSYMEHLPLRRSSVAAEIRAECARLNISVPKLSEGARIEYATLRRRLNGNKPFTIDELDQISHYLELPLAVLIERAEAHGA